MGIKSIFHSKVLAATGIALALSLCSVSAFSQSYSATTDKRATGESGYSSNGTEEKVVVANKARNPDGCCLDPRVERHYAKKIPTNTSDDFQWKGQVIVDKAKDTTVFQLLNADLSDSDRHRPVLFLEANCFTNRSGDKILRICDGRCSSGAPQIRWQKNDNNFHLKVKVIDGKTAKVYIDNVLRYTKVLDRYPNRPGNQYGDRTSVRYGAYHHDTKVVGSGSNRTKEAKSKAQIRIRGAEFRKL